MKPLRCEEQQQTTRNALISTRFAQTWWLEESRPLARDQVTRGGGFPEVTQLRSRLWPSWISAMEGWMVTTEEL